LARDIGEVPCHFLFGTLTSENGTAYPCEGFAAPRHSFRAKSLVLSVVLPEIVLSQGWERGQIIRSSGTNTKRIPLPPLAYFIMKKPSKKNGIPGENIRSSFFLFFPQDPANSEALIPSFPHCSFTFKCFLRVSSW
jgi:hypothetical protein